MDPAIAVITLFAADFAPRGWALCNGQILAIAQNSALFSLLGTTYGGDGRTTFALPDFRGRVPVGVGQGPGLPNVDLGERSGSETNTLTQAQMPQHAHPTTAQIAVSANPGSSEEASNNIVASNAGYKIYAPVASANGELAGVTATLNPVGGNQAYTNMKPYTGINFIIALVGIFPSRN